MIIPEKATAIGNRAFAGCASLKSISIPKNVLTISQDCFVDCDNLTEVYYGGTEEQWKQISIAYVFCHRLDTSQRSTIRPLPLRSGRKRSDSPPLSN